MKHLISGALALMGAIALAGAAQAADCAVSGVNGKLQANIGQVDPGKGVSALDTYSVSGAVAAPLGCMFGGQLDLGGVDTDGNRVGGAALHLFARDPSTYLIGVFGAKTDRELAPNVSYYGVEGEYYAGQFTVSALLGQQDVAGGADDGFGKLMGSWYAKDDIRLSAGAFRSAGQNLGSAGGEWQFSDRLSATADARFGKNDFSAFSIGLRYYFGASGKSLKDRNRQDDPAIDLFDVAQATQFAAINNLPLVSLGGCPAGYFYAPEISNTTCFR